MVIPEVIPVQLDLGHLMAVDINDITIDGADKSEKEEQLLFLANKNMSILLKNLTNLPRGKEDGSFKLPKPIAKLPRFKPVPEIVKPPTVWEQFARVKGIKKTKRSAMKYDENLGEYVARWGRNSAKNKYKSTDNWCRELKDGEEMPDD